MDSLMKRLGFVRLSRYGLVLTPEGRIMTLRQEILDDGYGGKVVGWLDTDLPSVELARWEPARPATHPAVAAPVARIAPAPVPAPIPAPILAFRPAPVPVAVVATPPPPAPIVASIEDEDDWEWTIAIARARAAAEETEVARAAKVSVAPAASPTPRRTRQETVPPPAPVRVVSRPAITMAAANEVTDDWPKTEPLTPLDYDDYTNPTAEIVRVAPVAKPPVVRPIAAKPAPAPTPVPPARPVVHTVARSELPTREYPRPDSAPSTVIPVPKLPRITDRHTIQPVVAAPRRFPKGTRPLGETTVGTEAATPAAKPEAPLGVAPPPPIRPAEDTQLGITPAPRKLAPAPMNAVTLPRIPGLKRAASQA